MNINELIEQIGGRERLEAIVYAMGAEPCDADPILDSVTHGDIGKMARALLAVLDAKPVAYIIQDKKDRLEGRRGDLDFLGLGSVNREVIEEYGIVSIPLYTTPPAASVPCDYFSSLVSKARQSAEKAMIKFPQPNYVLLKVAEEAGEVVQAGVHYAEGRETWENLEGEVVQTIAMLFRLVTEGDQVNGVIPPASPAPGGV